jgi:hypothetical protein
MVSATLAYEHPMKRFQPVVMVAQQRQGYALPSQGYAIAPASDYSASASYGAPPPSAGYGAPQAYAPPVAYPVPSYPTAYQYPVEEEGNKLAFDKRSKIE